MKKHIAAAALLVAGTSLVYAESSSENLLSLDMVSTWATQTLSVPSGNTLTSSNSGFTWGDGSTALTESWQLSFDWTSTNSNSTLQLFGSNGTSQTGAKGIVLEWKDSVLCLTDRGSATYVSISDVSKSSSDALSVVVTYLKSSTDAYASTLVLSVGGKTASGAAPTSDTDFLNGNGASRLWTNGGVDKFTNISLKSASAVPEPSAFGLLAGLGALALVGARRRRR